jgi:hypothetical protein
MVLNYFIKKINIMKIFNFIIFFWISFTLFSQNNPVVGSNELPENCACECFTVIDACSKKKLNIPGLSWTVSCSRWIDGRPLSVTVEADSQGKLCFPRGFKSGCLGNSTACLNGDNWEICRFTECSLPGSQCAVEVYQTLNTYPRINGQLLGSGFGTPGETGSFVNCLGERHSGALNTPNSATNLNLCPGDDAIFSMDGFSIPDSSGLCLRVFIFDENNVVVASSNYGNTNTTGNTVNISNLFTNLTPGVLYRIYFALVCCNDNPNCNINIAKFAYFRIQGPFSFSEYAIGGFAPNTHNFYPATSPPGTILQGETVIPNTNILINQFTLIGHLVQNTSNTSVNWSLRERNCETGAQGGPLYSGTITPQTGQPFNIGPCVVQVTPECRCYVLELRYFDECLDALTTKRYFFREGLDCADTEIIDNQEGGAFRSNKVDQKTDQIRLLQNPTDNQLMWDIPPTLVQNPVSISIFDLSGREIKTLQNISVETFQSLPFHEKDGMYIYLIRSGDQIFTGKFVKQAD